MKVAKYSFDAYLPKRSKASLVQVKVDDSLLDQVTSMRKQRKLTMKDLVEGLFRAWIDSEKEKK